MFLRYHNLQRSHQGYRLTARTPAQALCELLQFESVPPIVPDPEETTDPDSDKLAA